MASPPVAPNDPFMIETPLALLNLASIAATAADPACRLQGFVLGTNDLAKETRAVLTLARTAFIPSLTLAVLGHAVGWAFPRGGSQRLTRAIGKAKAMDLILTGRTISAAEAEDLGIINRTVADGTCLQAAHELAGTITQNSPTAIRASLEAINQLEATGLLDKALVANDRIFGRLMRTKDFKEGVTAFAEKRKPEWSGS